MGTLKDLWNEMRQDDRANWDTVVRTPLHFLAWVTYSPLAPLSFSVNALKALQGATWDDAPVLHAHAPTPDPITCPKGHKTLPGSSTKFCMQCYTAT